MLTLITSCQAFVWNWLQTSSPSGYPSPLRLHYHPTHVHAQSLPRPGSTQRCLCWKCHCHHHEDHSKHSALVQVQIPPILGTYRPGPPSPHPKSYTCINMKMLLRKFVYQHCLGSGLLTAWLRSGGGVAGHQGEEIKSFPRSKLWFPLWG